MSSNPKIVVLKTREIIYTLLLLFLAILLIICLVLMFSGKLKNEDAPNSNTAESTQPQTATDTSESPSEKAIFTAGIYTTPVSLGDSTVDVEVAVDQNHINSIRLVNLSEATAAAFPLVSPSLEHITSQILEKQTLEGITCPQENKYTSQLLLSAISEALDRARTAE